MWAFGVGKRKCVGESLANLELAVFTVGIVKHYRIGIKSFDGEHTCESVPGAIRRPKKGQLTFKRL